ncbi:MAG: M20/M25/M40 family metallo-hydrolase, partial [Candidatus Hodarchaeota archaeon]
KGATWLKLRIVGEEGHGSMPYRSNNAVVTLSDAIYRLSRYEPPSDTSRIELLTREIGIGAFQRFLLGSKILLPKLLGMMWKNSPGQAKLLHALSRMTISPNISSGGTKVNVIPGSAEALLDVRTLPGQNAEYVAAHLRNALGPLADSVEISEISPEEGGFSSYGTASDTASELVDTMKKITQELMGPEAGLVPLLSPGGTDCRFFREKWGTNSYGFSLFDDRISANELAAMAHGDNERVSLGTIDLTAKAYKMIVEEFLS